MMRVVGLLALVWLLGGCTAAQVSPKKSATGLGLPHHTGPATPGLLVVAPDRGFLGNEEARDAFASLNAQHNAELVFATDARTRDDLNHAVGSLVERGAQEVVVLPLFLSSHHPKLAMIQRLLGERAPGNQPPQPVADSVSIRFARSLGDSYLAVEILADRLRELDAPSGARLVVIGHGASDDISAREMEGDLQRIAEQAASGFAFESVDALVWPDASLSKRELPERFREALSESTHPESELVVVPFHLGTKLDSMMSFTNYLRRLLPEASRVAGGEVTPHAAVSTWMRREANRATALAADDVGVVFLAHGSDYHWNETMQHAVAPLARRYPLEFAFSMADQPVVERAVRRLEKRGVKGIVIVRVFGLESSFKGAVERMIGADVELPTPTSGGHGGAHGGGHGHGADHGHGHGHSAIAAPPSRIRSATVMTTLGGLEASELFAKALLDRAREHSSDPERETVVLVAHGAGEDARNQHWIRNLGAIADLMRDGGGSEFRAIRTGTWREDWPAKRQSSVAHIRQIVEEAGRDGGRAIVIPARTTGQGPERELLSGLSFELGSGFAPHPLFVEWVEEQVRAGIAKLRHTNAVGSSKISAQAIRSQSSKAVK
jgi:sirohydrochlorin ferrochelatase